MWRLLGILLILSGCGPVTHHAVTSYAKGIEQPTPGQPLLAAAPIDDTYRIRLTGGLSLPTRGAAEGDNQASLTLPKISAGGTLMLQTRGIEIGGIISGSLASNQDDDAPGQGVGKAALRLRTSAGDGRLRLGVSVDIGFRTIAVRPGTSVFCQVEPFKLGPNVRWVQVDDCWAAEGWNDDVERFLDPYLAATIYPTFELSDSLYAFAGLSLDSVTTGYTRSLLVTTYGTGLSVISHKKTELTSAMAFQAVAGLDARLGEFASVLINARSAPLTDGWNATDFTFEAALSIRY